VTLRDAFLDLPSGGEDPGWYGKRTCLGEGGQGEGGCDSLGEGGTSLPACGVAGSSPGDASPHKRSGHFRGADFMRVDLYLVMDVMAVFPKVFLSFVFFLFFLRKPCVLTGGPSNGS
jgi:hypothetical protein